MQPDSTSTRHPPHRAPVCRVNRYGRLVNAAILALQDVKHLQRCSERHSSLAQDLARLSKEVAKDLPRQLDTLGARGPSRPESLLQPALSILGSIERRLGLFSDLAASSGR
jgi:hypothetical protein